MPLHLQVLVYLRDQTRSRKAQLEERCGKGLDDKDYQRHVGRIAECNNQLELIAEAMKSGLEEVEDHEEQRRDQAKPSRSTARRNNRTQ